MKLEQNWTDYINPTVGTNSQYVKRCLSRLMRYHQQVQISLREAAKICVTNIGVHCVRPTDVNIKNLDEFAT